MNRTKIAWTQLTWNPITGCTPASAGCANCYCRAMERRFGWETDITFHPERIDEPRKAKGPARVFVCSMADLFHEQVKDEWLDRVFGVMEVCTQLTFQVLTKRAERMREYVGWRWGEGRIPSRHIWLGVTAENQEMADKRIPVLLQVPAAKRFVSVEPMLGPVQIKDYLFSADTIVHDEPDWEGDIVEMSPRVHWVICGCESGPKRRPTDIDWVRSLRDECIAARTPFFCKQIDQGGRVAEMPELDGRTWAEFPEVKS